MRDEWSDDIEGLASRLPRSVKRGALVGFVSLIIAAVIGWYSLALFGECDNSKDSYGWIKLVAGACFLVPGIVAARKSRTVSRTVTRTLVWMIVVGAFPLCVALLAWLNPYSGCRD